MRKSLSRPAVGEGIQRFLLVFIPFVLGLGSHSAARASDDLTISQPTAVATEAGPAPQAPGPGLKPSQNEGEKAPLQNRPTAVPEFSLPEVVITGENELTIGAKRLERKENDVTLGSHDLTGVERELNDLPGLSKTLTALSTEEAGPEKDTALVLHLGGGNPGTYGGWGLFGQEYKDFQYLLNGFYSTWSGQATGGGFDGDQKYSYGAQADFRPNPGFHLSLSGNAGHVDAELPYQNSLREFHDGWDFRGAAQWKLNELTQAQLDLSDQSTRLLDWDQSGLSTRANQANELEARFKVTAEDLDPFFNRFVFLLGGRHATSDFAAPAAGGYDWAWFGLQTYLKHGENLSLTAKLQGQGGSGLDLPFKFYPIVDFMWRVFEASQLDLYWKTDRYVENFHNNFMDTEHVSPSFGFPAPTEITGEWGGRLTQKLSEAVVLSLSASTAQLQGYHQWNDAGAVTPVQIQDYSTIGQVQLVKAGANLQWNFQEHWQAAAAYEWNQGTNASDSRNLTNLPANQVVLSLYRGDDQWEARLALQWTSDRFEYETLPGTLPAYLTAGLNATYHLNKSLSLWLDGDNLLGASYEIQPGYLEPQYHVRGGVEVIF